MLVSTLILIIGIRKRVEKLRFKAYRDPVAESE